MPASANPLPAPGRPRRLLVIANPVAGCGRARVAAPALCAALRKRGVEAEARFTKSAGDARTLARTAGDERWDGLIVAGGDGTLNEVLNGMPDPSLPLGLLPAGTGNTLTAEFGLPRDPERAAAVFAAAELREHAIGECDGRRFLLFVGAGLDGAAVERLEQVRRGALRRSGWIGPILHVARRLPRFSLRATFDDGSSLDGLSSVIVTRTQSYAGVARLTPDVDPGDGRLHVLCFSTRSRAGWLWHGVRALCGRLRPGRELVVRTAAAVTIDGDAPYQIDGDFGGRTPAGIRLLPQPARLFAPGRRGPAGRG